MLMVKFLLPLVLGGLLSACDPAPQSSVVEAAAENPTGAGRASFRMGNGEIRDDMIRMLDEAEIEYTIGDNNEIIYNLADGEAIDKIGNEAISEYITRN